MIIKMKRDSKLTISPTVAKKDAHFLRTLRAARGKTKLNGPRRC